MTSSEANINISSSSDETNLHDQISVPEAHISINETIVPIALDEFAPHVKIVKPSRSQLTYDRIE